MDDGDLSKGFLQHIESLGGIRILSGNRDQKVNGCGLEVTDGGQDGNDIKDDQLMSCSSFSDCESSGEDTQDFKDRQKRKFKLRSSPSNGSGDGHCGQVSEVSNRISDLEYLILFVYHV